MVLGVNSTELPDTTKCWKHLHVQFLQAGARSVPTSKAGNINRAAAMMTCWLDGNTYCREEGPVVDFTAGAAAGVLPELLDDRPEDWLRRQEAGSPQRPLHASLSDVPDVEVVIIGEEGRQAQAFLVDLLRATVRTKNSYVLLQCWLTGRLEVKALFSGVTHQ